jgi:hypothetical protein
MSSRKVPPWLRKPGTGWRSASPVARVEADCPRRAVVARPRLGVLIETLPFQEKGPCPASAGLFLYRLAGREILKRFQPLVCLPQPSTS